MTSNLKLVKKLNLFLFKKVFILTHPNNNNLHLLKQKQPITTKMPCYFSSMIAEYFVCDSSTVNDQIDDLENSLDVRSNLLYDFIDSTVYHFGPPSYDENTPDINKINFQLWRQETYAMITNDVDSDNLTEIEMDKCNMFWNAMEEHNLWADYITKEAIESVFNQSPISYQKSYIEILKIENTQQPHADNIEFDSSDDELSDIEPSDNDYMSDSVSECEEEEDDYTAEEALDIINNMTDEEDGISDAEDGISEAEDGISDAETIIVDPSDEEEDHNDDIFSEEAMALLEHLRQITNNDSSAIIRIIQVMQNCAQASASTGYAAETA